MAQQFDSDADARTAAGPDNSAVREVLERLAGAVTAGDARAAATTVGDTGDGAGRRHGLERGHAR